MPSVTVKTSLPALGWKVKPPRGSRSNFLHEGLPAWSVSKRTTSSLRITTSSSAVGSLPPRQVEGSDQGPPPKPFEEISAAVTKAGINSRTATICKGWFSGEPKATAWRDGATARDAHGEDGCRAVPPSRHAVAFGSP